MDTKQIDALLDTALEHFTHGWLALEKAGMVDNKVKDCFPPIVNNPVGSAAYHFAAVADTVKRAYELVRAEEEHTDQVMEKVNKALGLTDE